MNAVGFGMSVAALPGAFTATVDCFHYVQFARSFGADFNKCMLQLEISRWRLTQWGESMGLTADTSKNGTFLNKLSEEKARTATKVLAQIKAAFEDTEKLSSKHQGGAQGSQSATSLSMEIFNYTDLKPTDKTVYSTVREQAEQRQKSVGILNKTKWALSRRIQFDKLISGIQEFISALIELVPAAQDHQEAICKADLSHLLDERCLKTVRDVSPEDDKILKQAVAARVETTRMYYEGFNIQREKNMVIGEKNIGYDSTVSAPAQTNRTYRDFQMNDGESAVLGVTNIRYGNS